MSHAFDSARRKLERAERHFADLEREIISFTRTRPYEAISEPHTTKTDHTIHKLRLTTTLPPIIADICGEIVQGLRSSLDNAAFAVAVGSGKIDPKYCAFPFARNREQMINALGRSKDLPKEIQSLIVGFQPFIGGNDLLWALNEMANADKHKMVIPLGAPVSRTGVNLQVTGYFSMPDPHIWDREKNEMELFTLGPGAVPNIHFDLHISVAIHGVEIVDGKPVIQVLHPLCVLVERMIDTIEFESMRLGYVK
jgi:hypothetical protein